MADAQLDLLFGDMQPKKRRAPFPRSPNAAENNRRYREGLKARAEIVLPGSKTCCRCQTAKPAAEFHRNKSEPDGLATRCKPCKAEEHRSRFEGRSAKYVAALRKVCNQCGRDKPAEDFYRQTVSSTGLTGFCKSCADVKSSAYYQANKDKVILAAWVWQRNNKERARANRIASRCAKRALIAGVEGRFTGAEWLNLVDSANHRCEYCGREETTDFLLTADHRISMYRGGTNWIRDIAPACLSCNGSKGDKTPEEFAVWRRKNAHILEVIHDADT